MNEEFAAERASVVLNLAYRDRYYQTYNKAMRTRLRLFVSQSAHIKELFLVDRNGRVALSTDEDQENQVFIRQLEFFEDYRGVAVQVPINPQPEAPSSAVVLVPVYREDGFLLGAMAGRGSLADIEAILSEKTGLGATGKAYLVGAGSALIAGGEKPAVILTPGSRAVLTGHAAGSGIYADYRDKQVVGVYRWLPLLQAGCSSNRTSPRLSAPFLQP